MKDTDINPPPNRMRTFALTALLGLFLFNCYLGFSGQVLARNMSQIAGRFGVKLSAFSEAAFALQPCFFLVALAVVVVAVLDWRRRLSERTLIYMVVGLLWLDVVGLLISLWGFSNVFFLLSPPSN
jgi:uncharacterized membrane protein YwaF